MKKNSMTKEELLKLRLSGISYAKIAKEAGVSRQRVQKLLSPPREIRDFIVKRAEGKCQDCGIMVGKSGHVHHQNSGGEDYQDIENLMLLCPSCHLRRHYSLYLASIVPVPKPKIDKGRRSCLRCGHTWQPRKWAPNYCPKCKSMKWYL